MVSALALHCPTMRQRVFAFLVILAVALATARGASIRPVPEPASEPARLRLARRTARTGASSQSPAGLLAAASGELRYRMIGPHRGGRTKAAVGIPDQPNVFYIGAVNGGVWKTTDYGRTWQPIFDDQPTGSIGAIAVAPSNPDIIYVGSGEGLQRPDLSTGNGIYKSRDGGRYVDAPRPARRPADPADRRRPALARPPVRRRARPPVRRRTRSAGSSGPTTAARPSSRCSSAIPTPARSTSSSIQPNPDTVYAALWEARQGPWENGEFSGPGSGLYKSTDGGTSWRQLTNGLPTFEPTVSAASASASRRAARSASSSPSMRARTAASIGRTTAASSWALVNADPRVTSRGSDFAEVKVHPTNPDIVFTASIVAWKSVDGGSTFRALRGAPGGDDYHRIWINPTNARRDAHRRPTRARSSR